MPIFRRDAPAGPPPAAVTGAGDERGGARRGTVTLIAPGTRIKGEVSGSTEVQIEGEIEGNVRIDGLVVVGAGGSVLGLVHGRTVRVAGQVVGNVSGVERVEVNAAGSVEGDIAAPRVVIAEGAFFRGKIDMKSDHDRESRRPVKAGAETGKTAAAPARDGSGAHAANAAPAAQGTHAAHASDVAKDGSQ
jgi:cytoskeletal protein CcmA (bactofilin family)